MELFNKGYATSIITTGGFGPDPNFSEAHVGTQYFVQHGVDPGVIVTEQKVDNVVQKDATHRVYLLTVKVSDGRTVHLRVVVVKGIYTVQSLEAK